MNFLRSISGRNEGSIKIKKEVRFYVHDDLHVVKTSDITPTTSLNDYLRKVSNLTGTKVMCREGGCGCCIVVAIAINPVTKKEETFSVNSCLVSIYSCDGWRIVTVEGLKSPKTGYHNIQKALVEFNGTQCGFCTPGMVMSMYNLINKSNYSAVDVENYFGGNICRCTGYRSILGAFKSVRSESASNVPDIADIEDGPSCPLKDELKEWAHLFPMNETPFGLELTESNWYKVFSTREIFQLFDKYPKHTYRLVAGNTARGVYKTDTDRQLYIDIMNVTELRNYTSTAQKLELGANLNLTETMSIFSKTAKTYSGLKYLDKFVEHIDLVASVSIRNIGTLAGNLSIKYDHNEFPSDIFLLLETVGATLTIASKDKTDTVDMVSYLKMDMKHKVITKITLPSLNNTYLFNSYKIMPRAQNAHAIVNAGFLIQVVNSNVASARVIYGGINPNFIHAENLEKYLIGKPLFNNDTLQGGYQTLEKELKPDNVKPDPKPEFRKGLAIALFYKFVLSVAPSFMVSPRNMSGARKLVRPISNGTQDFETQKDMYPVTKPIPKIEAYAQVSGEAKYVMDHPDQPNQLFAALVLAKAPAYTPILAIDPSRAMLPGVVAFYSVKDIPGSNWFINEAIAQEKIFADKVIDYYSQPVGMIVANSQELAEKAVDFVKVTYGKASKEPILTIQDLIAKGVNGKIIPEEPRPRKSTGSDIKKVLKGTYYAHCQYHFYMENQSCNVIPTEDGLDVFPTTQWMDIVQKGISESTKIPAHKINIQVRRLGGAYGGKISRNAMPSCQAAIAAHLLDRPVKIWYPLETNMSALGKRIPCYATYEVAVDDKGAIQYLNMTVYMDYGTGGVETAMQALMPMLLNVYKTDRFQITPYHTQTDVPGNVSCRAPGTTEALGLIESIMEHIAYELELDPLAVRRTNWDEDKHSKLLQFLAEFTSQTELETRKKAINQFNKENRWRKKGISVVTMAYNYELFGNWNVHISVYRIDATVSVAHGGIEMGQGINTKVAQVCAYCLGIPLEKVQVKPSNNLVSPNIFTTGGSATSESVCHAVIKAADILKERMEKVKQSMKSPTWEQLVEKCFEQGIPLSSTYSFNPAEVKPYVIYGLCAAEVEVDILTGNHIVSRVDLLEDVGNSMSPLVDIGQVEGAFIMGMGYWSTEEIIMSDDGEVKTNRTWNYKPPGAKDIPVDFRVKFPKNNANPNGVFKSKATGEPPLCMACVIPFAIRRALSSARSEADPKAKMWFAMDGPTTVEVTFLNSLNDYKQYLL